MKGRPCHGTDHGYVCHLAKLCRHVTPEATINDAMLCTHLGFEHFMSHPSTTVGAISIARRNAGKGGAPEVAAALKREYARMLTQKPAQQQAFDIDLHARPKPAIGQNMELFS